MNQVIEFTKKHAKWFIAGAVAAASAAVTVVVYDMMTEPDDDDYYGEFAEIEETTDEI